VRNFKSTVAYDGTNYHGFQRQKELPTIQAELEDSLCRLVKSPVTIIGASRTDAGVHARGQVVTCRMNTSIPEDRFPRALNAELPNDIVIQNTEEVSSDFDPRYWPHKKTYSYQLYQAQHPSPFLRNYAPYIYYDLDLEAMQEAGEYLIGEYDFSSFRASGCVFNSPVRKILNLEIVQPTEKLITILVTGTSFLYNMVRIMVGTLMEVGKGELPPDQMKEILAAKDRTQAGPTAPACGLCLEQIVYKPVDIGYGFCGFHSPGWFLPWLYS